MTASATTAKQLAALEDASVSQSDKSTGYATLLETILSEASGSGEDSTVTTDLIAYINSLLSDSNLGIVAARPLLNNTVSSISKLPSTEQKISICSTALQSLQDRTSTFEEADVSLRQTLASAYQASDEFILAAKTLEGIPLESSSTSRKYSDWDKVNHWITICRLYIEEDDMLSAETFLNKAKTLRYKITDPELILKFSLSNARILDSKREFLDASQAYYSVSTSPALADEDRIAALTQAITTSILAPAGPPRSKFLGRLFSDDRSSTLGEPLYPILLKMHLSLLVAPKEIAQFASDLAPHQLAKTSDGSTVLAKAMIEHNLLAASRLYANISFESLAGLLGLSEDRAEEYAARMLEQGRMKGRIDQIDGWVLFESEGDANGTASVMRSYDATIKGITEDVERVASLIVGA